MFGCSDVKGKPLTSADSLETAPQLPQPLTNFNSSIFKGPIKQQLGVNIFQLKQTKCPIKWTQSINVKGKYRASTLSGSFKLITNGQIKSNRFSRSTRNIQRENFNEIAFKDE
jgi:hypothetical protein